MKVLVTTEERFVRTPDGKVWSGGSGAYPFWLRYLNVFDSVGVLARIANSDVAPESWYRADGEGVAFCALPHFVGVTGQLKHYRAIRAAVKQALSESDAIILREFSVIAPYVVNQLPASRPFGIEVVGDPYEVFGRSTNIPFRSVLRWWFTNELKEHCRKACAVAYVTDYGLRERYRASDGAYSTIYSSIELNDDSFVAEPRQFHDVPKPIRIASIGSMERLYKGFDVLIDAVAACKQAGVAISLRIVGEGRHRAELEEFAKRRDLESEVTFTGRVAAGSPIRQELDRSDLFVLASKTEGLPRAMIEAMARALPCIGTNVGGIPELLSSTELVPSGDSGALARKILEFASNPQLLSQCSAQNLAKSREYHSSVLSSRRQQFYQFIENQTERWNLHLQTQHGNTYSSPMEVTRSNTQ